MTGCPQGLVCKTWKGNVNKGMQVLRGSQVGRMNQLGFIERDYVYIIYQSAVGALSGYVVVETTYPRASQDLDVHKACD